MIRLFVIELRLAFRSSETLFGLGLELFIGFFCGLLCSIGQHDIANLIMLPYPAAVFIAFALSLDSENGAIRNKLIAGYSRLQYYLSKTFTAVILGIAYSITGLIPAVIFCWSWMTGRSGTELLRILLMIVSSFVITAVVSAVVCCLISSRTAAIIGTVVVIAVLSFGGSRLTMVIGEREYIWNEGFTVTENEAYIGGVPRYILRAAAYSTPFSHYYLAQEVVGGRFQTLKRDCLESAALHQGTMAEKEALAEYDSYCEKENDLAFIPLYTLGMSMLLTTAGYLAFRKKNIE